MFKTLWSPGTYWPIWLGGSFAIFLIREIWALSTHRAQDTFSDWTWRELHIVANQSPGNWGAGAFLTFGAYIVGVVWLAWHLWLHKFG